MPVYTYRCTSCGAQFEKHQGFHDAALKTCPECRKKTLKKVITPTKVIFKGSGFYITDNKSASGGKSSSVSKTHDADHSSTETKTAEKASSEGKSEKKSKSKAEAKSE